MNTKQAAEKNSTRRSAPVTKTAQPVGVNRELLKSLITEVIVESVRGGGEDINTEAANDLAGSVSSRFIADARNLRKQKIVATQSEKRVREVMHKLEEAQKVLEFANPLLVNKSRAWGRNNETRKKAIATTERLVSDALDQLKAVVSSSVN